MYVYIYIYIYTYIEREREVCYTDVLPAAKAEDPVVKEIISALGPDVLLHCNII